MFPSANTLKTECLMHIQCTSSGTRELYVKDSKDTPAGTSSIMAGLSQAPSKPFILLAAIGLTIVNPNNQCPSNI